MKILLVEDNDKNMKLLRDVLQAKGYAVLEAGTGEEAVTIAGRHRPDLVLMDVRLPGIDGVEALRRLRANVEIADVAVVALTAQAMDGDHERFVAAGFDHYLSKPIDLGQLLATVERFRSE